jgi:ATP-dependent Clp protease ATP-binding subunit ClpA
LKNALRADGRSHSVAETVILFIDEAHTLIGAGNAQGGLDISNLLKPALARGELKTIAATTWSEYKKYFEKDAALSRRFQLVKVSEPNAAEATIILRGLSAVYEQSHGVLIDDEALTGGGGVKRALPLRTAVAGQGHRCAGHRLRPRGD